MSRSIIEERYSEEGLTISEYTVEIDGDYAEIIEVLNDEVESDAVIVVQALQGEFESALDVPLEARDTRRQQDAYFVGVVGDQSRIEMRFQARGIARIRVLIGRVRRAFGRAGGRLPCKLCKLAISLIIHVVLVSLGVPPGPNGTFDLGHYLSQLQQAFTDITNGAYGHALHSLQSILPNGWWTAILGILRALAWLFDATDAFYHDVCHALGLCYPRHIPANP